MVLKSANEIIGASCNTNDKNGVPSAWFRVATRRGKTLRTDVGRSVEDMIVRGTSVAGDADFKIEVCQTPNIEGADDVWTTVYWSWK